MKTIICPTYLKTDLINRLLGNKTALSNIKILPLDAYLKNTNSTSDIRLLLEASKKINAIKDSLNLYKEMVQYPDFIGSIFNFSKKLFEAEVDLESLPEDTLQEKELKLLLMAIKDLPYNKKILNIYDNTEVIDFFSRDIFEDKIKSKILETSKLITLSTDEEPSVLIKYALNQREEIEAIAQDICHKQNYENSTLVVLDKTSLPIINQVFKRYNIPIKNINFSLASLASDTLVKTIRFAINKDIKTLLSLLKLRVFSLNKNFIESVENHLSNINDFFTSTDDTENLIEIKEDLNLIYISSTYKDILINSYNLLVKYTIDYKNEKNSLLEIKTILEDSINLLEDEIDLNIIINRIENISTPSNLSLDKGLTITSIDRPVFSNNYTYVLGCTSKNYPGFKVFSGIFDEAYIAKIKYPNLEDRYSLFLNQIEWIKKSARKQLIYSYHISNLAGKKIEAAFEIESLTHNSRWGYIYNDYLKLNDPSLSQENAKKLFLKDDMVYGSVSSFETYMSSPYQYFIRYGLKINTYKPKLLDNFQIGIILHAILYKLIQVNPKDYYDKIDDLDSIILEEARQIKEVYPNNKQIIDLFFKKIKKNILDNLIYLKEMEKDTSFIPTNFEYRFKDIQFNNIVLNGIIDRIDTAYDFIRIIDYKSGSNDLMLSKIKKGNQLQLATYILVASSIFNKKPMGAFYYNFSTSIKETDKYTDDLDTLIKNKRLNGLLLSKDITSLTFSDIKKYYQVKVNMEDKDLEMILNEIYSFIYQEISRGNIQVDALEYNFEEEVDEVE